MKKNLVLDQTTQFTIFKRQKRNTGVVFTTITYTPSLFVEKL